MGTLVRVGQYNIVVDRVSSLADMAANFDYETAIASFKADAAQTPLVLRGLTLGQRRRARVVAEDAGLQCLRIDKELHISFTNATSQDAKTDVMQVPEFPNPNPDPLNANATWQNSSDWLDAYEKGQVQIVKDLGYVVKNSFICEPEAQPCVRRVRSSAPALRRTTA